MIEIEYEKQMRARKREREKKTGREKVRKLGSESGIGNLFHYKMDRDTHRLDIEGPENNQQIQCFSQRSEESMFRYK